MRSRFGGGPDPALQRHAGLANTLRVVMVVAAILVVALVVLDRRATRGGTDGSPSGGPAVAQRPTGWRRAGQPASAPAPERRHAPAPRCATMAA